MKKYAPAVLPIVKGEFVDYLGGRAARERIVGRGGIASRLWEQLLTGEMVWVSREMTALTVSAVDSLPEGTGYYPAADAGLVLFEGSTGFEVELSYLPRDMWVADSFGSLRPPVAVLDGVMWSYPAGEPKPHFIGFTLNPPIPAVSGRRALMVDVQGCYEAVEALMMTMWLLSSQPDIASERVEQVAKGGGKSSSRSAGKRDKSDVMVRFVSLRRREREYVPAKDAVGKWKLEHRVLVRGHWRQQAYGKDRAKRRPVFIRPYIKGEDGQELVLPPVVKIWD